VNSMPSRLGDKFVMSRWAELVKLGAEKPDPEDVRMVEKPGPKASRPSSW